MRLQAVAVRLFARSMRAERTGARPTVPSPSDTSLDQHLSHARVTEQAKGILAARFDCSIGQTLTLLEGYSRRVNQPLHLFAHEIVSNKGCL
ncbi:ANTAR domain-containing protein [Streptomyces sp. NPDC055099]